MKVAVCISGQLRQWRMAKDNHKWFWTTFNFPELEVDYFIHTWSYSWDRPGISHPYQERDVTEEEFLEFREAYDAKKAIYDTKRQTHFFHNDHWSSLFYSLGQSLLLKRQYEIENDFQYDLVVKSRPDVVFSPDLHAKLPDGHTLIQDGRLYTTHGGTMPMEFYINNFNDCVFFGNSYTMDLLPNLYFYRQQLINDLYNEGYNIHPLGPGTLMHEFFRDYGITPYFGLEWSETLLKEGCPKVDLFDKDEFYKLQKYFRKWYTK